MARKDSGSGGRGGYADSGIDLEAFAVVAEDEELSRSRVAPSELQPLVDMARQNIGRKFERTDPVQDTDENGEPLWEADEDGNPKMDENGNPVPVMVRVPHIYKLEEAKAFAADLRNVGNRNKLPARRLSLRVVADPPLAKATEEDEIRVQFYIVGRTPQEQPQSA
jgi:hypothetical protein